MNSKIAFLIFVVIAICYTFSNIGKLIRNKSISIFQILAMAIGIAGVIGYFIGVY